VAFKQRDFSDALGFPEVAFVPRRYGWSALGGPEFATLTAFGPAHALWSLTHQLRAPVEVLDGRGTAVWWGYLASVTVRVGAITVGVSLDTLYNRVAVAYAHVAPGTTTAGTRATTAWAQNDDSVSRYGSKELLASLQSASPELAEARRATLLAQHRYPIPLVEQVAPGRGSLSATLRCRGWWATLGWTYYDRAAYVEEHTDDANTSDQTLGAAAGNTRVTQSFQLTAAWTAYSVQVRLKAVESPGDSVRLDLCADNSGAPGTVLDSVTVPASSLTTSYQWIEFALDPLQDLAGSVTYWIVLRRTGGLDATNHYAVEVDEDLGYTSGQLRLYNGSTWVARTPDADVLFSVTGVEETTTQVATAVGDAGEFITAVDVVDASGVYSSPYRSGDDELLAVVGELLAGGTSDGRRLLTRVTRDRVLRVYEEPELDTGAIELFVNADGRPEDRWGNARLAHTCPVAQWCALKDVIPPTLSVSQMSDPSYFFVERAEFDVQQQVWLPEPRGVPSAWDLGQLLQG
jgi:hypothetical protein